MGNNIKTGMIIAPNNDELFRRYMNDIRHLKPLGKKEELRLFKRIKKNNDKEAIDTICKHNLLFVVKMAKKYSMYLGKSTLTLEDLINEGNLGLYLAIEKFDYTTGNKFLSYAVWWIRQHILKLIQSQGKAIKLPAHIQGYLKEVANIERSLIQEHHREVDLAEIFEAINKSDKIKYHPSFASLDSLLSTNQHAKSLNLFIGEDNSTELIELLESDIPSGLDTMIKIERKNRVREMITRVPDDIADYLIEYFGLFGTDQLTVAEIAEKHGKNAKHISYVIHRQLHIMKHYNRHLKNYFLIE